MLSNFIKNTDTMDKNRFDKTHISTKLYHQLVFLFLVNFWINQKTEIHLKARKIEFQNSTEIDFFILIELFHIPTNINLIMTNPSWKSDHLKINGML